MRTVTVSSWSPIRQVEVAVSGPASSAHVAEVNAVGSHSSASPARRPPVDHVIASSRTHPAGRSGGTGPPILWDRRADVVGDRSLVGVLLGRRTEMGPRSRGSARWIS